MVKYTLIILAAMLVALAEISMVWAMPYPLNLFFLPVQILVFLIIFDVKRYAWLFVIIAGLIFDIFSFSPLGLNVLVFACLFIIGRFLFYNYLTNRSLMSAALLCLSMIFLYELFNYVKDLFFSGDIISYFSAEEVKAFIFLMVINFAGIVIIYLGLRTGMRIFKKSRGLYEKI
ncbi:hypothetical protein KJ969_05220 [Patescibacteria group bacterium]|nr:hypothetical protein [Patescibacteria group bacterium]MBU1921623.1 hypothetical protein [Patescibacteria group bacterium]